MRKIKSKSEEKEEKKKNNKRRKMKNMSHYLINQGD